MAESAGSVYVTIDGDSSPLIAKYAQAEAQSRAAGQRIASALGSGFSQATGLVDQFGRSVSSGVIKPLEEVPAAAKKVAEGINQLGEQAKKAQEKTQSFVGVIPGLGRAAEHFINLLPGVGQAIMAAFPVLGAIALTENLVHLVPMVGKIGDLFGGVSEDEKKAADEAARFSREIADTDKHVRNLAGELEGLRKGAAAGAEAALHEAETEATIAAIQLATARTKLHGGDRVTSGGREFIRPGHAPSSTMTPEAEAAQKAQSDLDAAQLQVQIRGEELRKQRESDAKKLADEEKRATKEQETEDKRAAAEFKRQWEAVIHGVSFSRRQAMEEEKRIQRDNTRDMLAGLREGSEEGQRAMEQQRREMQDADAERNRANQADIRAAGIRQQATDDVGKLKLQAEYALQVAHTRQREVEYAVQIANADAKSLADRLANLEALREYQILNGLVRETNQTDLEIERAKADIERQKIQSKTATTLAQRAAGIGSGLIGAANQFPSQIGGALAAGVVGGQIGHQIAESLKGIGKEMMGDVFKDLIAAMVGNSLTTLANTAATELNTVWLAVKGIVGGILGFAGGGRPPVGMPSIVGERGPELFIPDGPGTIIPNIPSSGIGATPLTSSMSVSSASVGLTVGAIHLHGIRDVRDVARRLPAVLKATAPNFSPATR